MVGLRLSACPPPSSSIDGIEVQARLRLNNNGLITNLCAQLSWDGGASWTTIQAQDVAGGNDWTTYTFGGAADTWGRAWTLGELEPANLRVRIIDAASQTTKNFQLDGAPAPGHVHALTGQRRSEVGPRPYTSSMSAKRRRTAADLLVECLEAEGCEYVFSVPGEETMDVLEALSRSASACATSRPATSRAPRSWPTSTAA